MNSARGIVFGAFGGAGATLAVLWLRAPAEPAPPPAPATVAPTAELRAPPGAAAAAGDLDLTPVTSRLDETAERLRRLEEKLDALAAGPQRAPAPGARPASIDVESLMQAMAGVERKQLEALSNEALRQRARQSMKAGGDVDASVRALEVLLERSLSPEERADVLVDLGTLQRTQGGEAALAASARTLRAVIDAHGMHSKPGIAAAHQLVWTCSAQKDFASGLGHAQAIVGSPAASRDQRIQGRWAGAIMVQQLGDAAGARAGYEQLLREIDGMAGYEKLAADIRSRLAKM